MLFLLPRLQETPRIERLAKLLSCRIAAENFNGLRNGRKLGLPDLLPLLPLLVSHLALDLQLHEELLVGTP